MSSSTSATSLAMASTAKSASLPGSGNFEENNLTAVKLQATVNNQAASESAKKNNKRKKGRSDARSSR